MSDAAFAETRFQHLVNPQPAEADERIADESDYMWRGQRYRIVPIRQAPLMQFRLTVSPRESLQIKYAYITHQSLNRCNVENRNEIVMIVRDSMRITLAGLNLGELDDALLMQRVLDIQSVSVMQGEAALKRDAEAAVIIEVRVEYGRFDSENHRWLPGAGSWCPRNRRWAPEVGESAREVELSD